MSGDKLTLSLTVLLTGFAVVFVVLLLLIGIIKLYGTVIYNIQNKGHKNKKNTPPVKVVSPERATEPAAAVGSVQENDDELIAVISAAVYSVYSSSQVRIKSIRKSPTRSNAWRSAGLSDNTRPF